MAEDEMQTEGSARKNPTPSRRGALAAAGVLIAGGALAGAIITGTTGASAATDPSQSESATAPGNGSGTTPSDGGSAPNGDSTSAGRSDETPVTGADYDTLKAAALAAVPGGTVDRIETDAGDATYEAHMTKADGTKVTVKFGDDLKVTAVEDGMGKGDPQDGNGPRGHGGPPSGQAAGSAESSAGA